jgi:protein-L-isoaspartate(D-aspartate) O-methyltransferase
MQGVPPPGERSPSEPDPSGELAAARRRLVERLRGRIRDERVLAALVAVPRELFVPAGERERAYANTPLPIGHGQTISQPLVVAHMCELLELRPTDRVLDVGTGSGYHAAVLARLSASVCGVERDPDLAAAAAANLAAAGIDNVTVVVGDGRHGLAEHAPFDGINVAAAAARAVPRALEEQLAPGGRLVAPVQGVLGQRLIFVRRTAAGFERIRLDPVRFVTLRGT